MFHYMFKAEFVTLASVKVPSGRQTCFLQDVLQRTKDQEDLPWTRSLHSYYERDEWELYDIREDPDETKNLVRDPLYQVCYIVESYQVSFLLRRKEKKILY